MENKFLYYLKPILRVLIFLFFIFLWSVPFSVLFQFEIFKFSDDLFSQLFFEFAAILIVVGALLMIFQIYPARNFETIFIKRNALIPFFRGSSIGFLLIGICATIMYFLNSVEFTSTKILPLNIAGYLLFFILVGVFEEFTFRSFPLVVFAERYLVPVTVLCNGILFGLIHYTNPGFSALAMANITLCGILFSIITLQKGNIWWAVGIHFAWNFTQGNLLGFKVSGLAQSGLIAAKPVGNPILSGGIFGIEGSAVCTIILIIYIFWLLFNQRIIPVKEIEAL
ncbi:CPBP family intramembrane glutamic endopeptidase [Pedobacter lithocola]|uniref:CPBP family intramembrane glutamic endopeptidase n=1 Tax=Pedobacter lithocola TaxID=1908239 RepID=A0ABV8P8X3_9SPHI